MVLVVSVRFSIESDILVSFDCICMLNALILSCISPTLFSSCVDSPFMAVRIDCVHFLIV